jgi:hypothetical protein
MNDIPYRRRIDRNHPGCIIFLLDQSYSMIDPLPDRSAPAGPGGAIVAGRPKAIAVAEAVNKLIYTLVLRATKDAGALPRHHFDIGVVGYGGTEVGSLFTGEFAGRRLASVAELATAVSRYEERDGLRYPVWFDALADGGTPMCGALNYAGETLAGWITAHRDSFPPIVINITDGIPTDGDPELWTQRLRNLKTNDGNVLFFTIHLSEHARRTISFPSSEDELPDQYAKKMFAMCSELPDFMRTRAAELGVPASPGARGLVCNADISAVLRALEVGTSVDYLTR